MAIRFRRLDEHNFVRESEKTAQDTMPGGKPNPRAGEKYWEIDGFYSRLDWMIRDALRDGVGGNSIKELAESLKQSEKNVMDALNDAVRTQSLSMIAIEGKIAAKRAVAQENWRKRKEKSTVGDIVKQGEVK